jgi:uncharacterized protein YjdB
MVVSDKAGNKIASSSTSSISFKVNDVTTYTITLTAVNSNGLKAVRSYHFTTRNLLIHPKSWTPQVGSTKQVYVKHANSSVKWTYTSSNPAVASVDADGNVKALSKGTATITAKYNGVTAVGTFTVTVS